MDAETSDLIDNVFRCYRLAAACTDALVAQRLREVGADYYRRALARGADPEILPRPDAGRKPARGHPPGSGASSGK
jgi:hypothetical protein